MLLNIAIEQMLSGEEPELGVQLMGVIRLVLDPENMLTEKTEFLNFFYKHSIQTLIGKYRFRSCLLPYYSLWCIKVYCWFFLSLSMSFYSSATT